MRITISTILLTLSLCSFSNAQNIEITKSDSAIRRVDDCVCYKHIDSQNLKPWEIEWDNPEKLRKQISHCVCSAEIDIQKVENPRRYLVPGTIVK
jgi:hypothetical protein